MPRDPISKDYTFILYNKVHIAIRTLVPVRTALPASEYLRELPLG